MKRSSSAADACPVAQGALVIGDWWSLLIVRDAMMGKRRFGEFERSLGVAKNILTDRLKKLVADGVLQTAPAADGGAHHEYLLTERGNALLPVLVAIGQWAACPDAPVSPVDRKTGKPVKLVFRTSDGRTLEPAEVRLAPGEN